MVPVVVTCLGSATTVLTTSLYTVPKALKVAVCVKVPVAAAVDNCTAEVAKSTPTGTLLAKAVSSTPT